MKKLIHPKKFFLLSAFLALVFLSKESFAQSDACGSAPTITSSPSPGTCTAGNLPGTATYTSIPGGTGCSGSTNKDVWFTFIAQTTNPTIKYTAGTLGNGRIQLFSGSCASMTSLLCSSGTMSTSGLNTGSQYWIRIYSTNAANTGTFNICITDPAGATYDYGKSYVNITRGTGGGTINPGDTLEIRGTLVIRSQSLDSLAFFDTLYNNSGVRLVPGSISLRTNEGKIYKSFTDATGDDAGYQYTNGLDTVIRINMGSGSSSTSRGSLSNTSKPSVFKNTCIIMATYRVVVYANYGSTINIGGGAITYKDATTGVTSSLSFSPRNAFVYSSPGLCPNAVSATNAIGGDFNGTFGTPSGSAPYLRNRGTSTNVPSYIYKPFTSTGGPNDYYYGIANNTSQSFTTVTTWAKPDNSSPTHRVFNVWDITGDHTGASNTAKGNPPCDTTQPISATNPCGYMLIINSAYKTDTAFQYTVTNLCPNTYYEISAWMKNICYKCGCDSNGNGASSATYIPFATNDSSGVQPNLAFDINGTDYYTTGNIAYSGIYPTTQSGSDSVNSWVKRGFTYLTGLSQTSLTLTIRNNAPGGGGNDWALDDIAISTCLPSMQYSPSITPAVCMGNTLSIYDTVRSYFSNYTYFKWQRSTDNGTNWNDITSTIDTTLSQTGSSYQFLTKYTIPPSNTAPSDSADLYRVLVASTAANLSNTSCMYTDATTIITLSVNDCGVVLKLNLLSFSGKLNNGNAELQWVTANENEPVSFDIEKSFDGINFTSIATVKGYGNKSVNNFYQYTDPTPIHDRAWYRIAIYNNTGSRAYSRTILLNEQASGFSLNNVINPFSNDLNFEVSVPQNSRLDVALTSLSGKQVRKESFVVNEGTNNLIIPDTENLLPGIYILQVKNRDETINRKVMKK